MKKIIILGLVLLMVVVFATSIFGKAEKSDLIDNDGTKTTDPIGDVVGFVILNNPNPDEEDDGCNLVVVVSLKNGEPNTSYNVFLEEWNGSPKWSIIGGGFGTYDSGNPTLDTNEVGHGNIELRLDTEYLVGNTLLFGVHTLSIVLTKSTTWTDFVSTAVEITLK
jgi:hypothetical protein